MYFTIRTLVCRGFSLQRSRLHKNYCGSRHRWVAAVGFCLGVIRKYIWSTVTLLRIKTCYKVAKSVQDHTVRKPVMNSKFFDFRLTCVVACSVRCVYRLSIVEELSSLPDYCATSILLTFSVVVKSSKRTLYTSRGPHPFNTRYDYSSDRDTKKSMVLDSVFLYSCHYLPYFKHLSILNMSYK